jgi:HK97 family phage major capsid protein
VETWRRTPGIMEPRGERAADIDQPSRQKMKSKLWTMKEQRAAVADQLSLLAASPMNNEQRKQYDALFKESELLAGDIQRLEQAAGLQTELSARHKPPRAEIEYPAGWYEDDFTHSQRGRFIESPEEAEYRKTFSRFVRSGDRTGVRYESRALGISSPTASVPTSVLVPQGFVQEIEQALLYYCPFLRICRIIDTATGAPLPFPVSNDTGNSATIIGEGLQVSEATPTLSNIIFGAYKLTSGLVKVSLELAQDSAFDVDRYLIEQFATRFGRGLSGYFTNGAGSGSSEPNGVLTAATAGPTAVGSAANTGGSETGANSIGSADIVELEHAVDPSYRQGALYMMHDSTLKFLKKLVDKYGHPLLWESAKDGMPQKINGYEVVVNNDMPEIGTGNKTVLFGNFQKYAIRRVKEIGVLRLSERFADYGQIGFIGFARYDGNLLDAGTHPVKYLVQA